MEPFINAGAQLRWLMLRLKLNSPRVTGLIPWLGQAFSSFSRIPPQSKIFISHKWQLDVRAPPPTSCEISKGGKKRPLPSFAIVQIPCLLCTVNRRDKSRGERELQLQNISGIHYWEEWLEAHTPTGAGWGGFQEPTGSSDCNGW